MQAALGISEQKWGILYLPTLVQKRRQRVAEKTYIRVQHLEYKFTRCTMAYHKWDMPCMADARKLEKVEIVCCVLFLPILCEGGFCSDQQSNGVYTVIAEDWKVLDEQLNFGYPSVESWFEPE